MNNYNFLNLKIAKNPKEEKKKNEKERIRFFIYYNKKNWKPDILLVVEGAVQKTPWFTQFIIVYSAY